MGRKSRRRRVAMRDKIDFSQTITSGDVKRTVKIIDNEETLGKAETTVATQRQTSLSGDRTKNTVADSYPLAIVTAPTSLVAPTLDASLSGNSSPSVLASTTVVDLSSAAVPSASSDSAHSTSASSSTDDNSIRSTIESLPSPFHSEDSEAEMSTMSAPTTATNTPIALERKTIHMSHYGGSLKNKLDQGDQVFRTVEDFVSAFVEDTSKRRPIKRVLVATNGIAAVRCILSIRKLLMQLFRDDKMIKFICLTTQHEIASNAEYLKLADYIVFSPGGDNRNNYANVNEIVSHAVEQRVDAVWAGWGHASENPELPRQLAKRDIVFIGPPANAMFSLGDKIASTIIAQTLDIPTIEWSGNGLRLDLDHCTTEAGHITVSQELFNKATVKDLAEGLRALEEHKIGYPLMIKASEGGGGKGIRKCKNEADFRENFQQVLTEVPGSPIFLMKCVENARHIEVQLIADRYETVIPVFTRDCSIQRRCQKIIEEAPANIAPEETLRRMQKDAVKIARLVGYESAGTVEYMYLPDENKYYFLELNPRLQVEHPCTEMLANVNIPAIQMQIAMGLPLHRITDIRLFYGLDRYDNTPLPDELVLTKTDYAVIAARITSEDPEDFFRPSTGSVEVLNFRSAQNVWGYFSVSSAGKVHEFADSQFGHLFARGRTRHEAISVMLCALQELELRATFASQVSYLVDMLKEPDFTHNRFNTQWLDNRIANKVLQKSPLPMHEIIALSSAVIGHSRVAGAFNNFKNAIERGQILPTKDLTETFLFDLVKDMNIYKVTVTRSGPLLYIVSMNGTKTQVEIRLLGDGSLLCAHKERIYTCNLEETTDKFKVTIGRSIVVFEKDNDPTILKSPYTGKLLGYKKANKEWVGVGAIYASVESMKLVFNVEVKKAPGRLEYVAKEGDLLYPGSVIARLVDQKDSEKYRPKPFLDTFPEWMDETDADRKLTETKLYNQCYDKCINILKGSIPPGVEERMPALVDELFRYLESRTLPDLLLSAAVNPVLNRLPPKYATALKDIADKEGMAKFEQINHLIEDYFQTIRPNEFDTVRAVTEPIISLCDKFRNGTLSNSCHVVNALLTEYNEAEKFFEGRVYDDAVALLIDTYPSDKDQVVSLIYSHTQLKGKNKFMKEILTAVARRGMHFVGPLEENLREAGNMFHTEDICELARQLLLQNCRFKYRKFLNKIIWDLNRVPVDEREIQCVLPVDEAITMIRGKLIEMVASGESLGQIAESSPWIAKVLHEYFFDSALSSMAIRSYIRQRFGTEDVTSEKIIVDDGIEVESYDFSVEKCPKMQHLTPWESKNQFFSIVKLQLSDDKLLSTITNDQLVMRLAEKYNKAGVKSNGVRPTLHLMLLVGMNNKAENRRSAADFEERIAQLEELPNHSTDDDTHLKEAENSMEEMKRRLSEHMPAVNINARILVCQPHKPLVQLDLVGTEILELWRLPTEAVLVSDRLCSLQVYKYDDSDKRYSRLFVREIIEMTTREEERCEEELLAMIHSQLDNACGAINVSMRKFKKNIYVANHILLHVSFRKLPADFTTRYADMLDEIFEHAIKEQREILYKHHVTEVEIVYTRLEAQQQQLVKRRVKFLDETGVTPEFGIYDQYKKRIVPQKLSHQLYGEELEPHSKIKKIEKKRAQTRINGTTYVYDFPTLFGRACLEEWKQLRDKTTYGEGTASQKSNLFEEQFAQLTAEQRAAFQAGDYRKFFNEIELLMTSGNELKQLADKEELRRRADNCNNETGVVAWILRLFTPEKPTGYDTVVIANDITYQSGSFAMPEDLVYSLASEFSRKHKIPRINVSSNSGARIGLADEVSKVFRAKFKNPEKPDDGFDYLYVDASEEDSLNEQIVYERMPNGQLKLKAVVGKENENIGVENLQGSGLIAGETSAAYDEVPTYCFVTGRTVGIGAYTARLAHRVVQARSSHIILTGAPALNTLLGKEVYTSNNQLGGIQIMYKNGVTHAVVNDDFEGICKILHWMSYLPTEIPAFPYRRYIGLDSAPRPVHFPIEPNKPYDIRQLIDSRDSTEWRGICDSNSFDEIMNDWAKTIIAGRARIGGIPLGVVSSELRNVCTVNPADPASPNSQSVEVHQAGQVWYPDSAFKTAEVIGDFNREGLPLLFIASLRGFSGGQRDMFEMVLKFGAQIVDALRKYRQPVIIYIPTYGELRGGAWVVLDSKINPGFIHMVADRESRGGILEPNAIVGIKFRGDKLLALQKRNDEAMRRIDEELAEEIKTSGANSERAVALNKMLLRRSEELKKAYRGVTEELADLHDRAERMERKGAVQHVTELAASRNLFIDILTLESAKILLAEKYLQRAERSVNQQDAYVWLTTQLEAFRPGVAQLRPHLQTAVLKEFVETHTFQHLIDTVKAESVARELCEMTDDELERIREILQQRGNRKFSL